MSNVSDYITGDDMTALLIAEGGDEGATYAPGDRSRDALIARNRTIFVRCPVRHAHVGYCDISIGDHDALERMGLITLNHYAPGQSFMLTDTGAALGVSLVG